VRVLLVGALSAVGPWPSAMGSVEGVDDPFPPLPKSGSKTGNAILVEDVPGISHPNRASSSAVGANGFSSGFNSKSVSFKDMVSGFHDRKCLNPIDLEPNRFTFSDGVPCISFSKSEFQLASDDFKWTLLANFSKN